MESENPRIDDGDDDEGTTTDQIKLKAQEIAKRLEKYQGRYHSSSRCNTPLPITSAESIESIHSASIISDTSEKLLLFRQFLENDRKLVEDNKIDERKYSNDDSQSNGDELLDVQPKSKDEKENLTYYENIIETQYNEKNIQSLKNQIIDLNEKLKNCQNVVIEKDVLLQTKIDKIESLSKTISQKNRLHLETVDALKQKNIEIVNDERLRFSQKINQVVEETEELKNNLDYIDKKYDDLRKSNIKIDKENNELRKRENYLKSEIEQLSINYENEKKILLQQNMETSKKVVEGMEKELHHLQQENDLLKDTVSLLESKSIDNQENDDVLTKLNLKEDETERLNLENYKLSELYENLKTEFQETENRWTQLKDAYLNDKNRMTFLEKVVEELKMNNDELSNSNVKLNESLEKSAEDVITLKTENSALNDRIADLMAVIENMREQFEKALKDNSIEFEHDKKLLIQQHEHEKSLLKNSDDKLNESTSKLIEVTNQLNIVLNENDAYKRERIELDSCIGINNAKISELNNIVNELQNQMFQMANELEFLRKENSGLSDKVNGTTLELEENKLLSDRFLKQKQLLKVKIKALKESENNCLLLQQKVTSLTEQIQDFNKNTTHIDQNNSKISSILHYCDTELQICYELLNKLFANFDVKTQNLNMLQSVLVRLASFFPINCFDDVHLSKVIDSFANIDLNDNNELQSCLKKIIMGSIQMFEYIMHLKHAHKLSEAQSIARTEVDKLITEAVEKVKISTENEYNKHNNELLNLIENLEHDNHMLKLNIASNIHVLESKEVLTDLHGPTATSLLSLDIFDVENIKNENDTLKQFIKNIYEKLGLVNFEETNNVVLLSSLSELELLIQEIKNENFQLKSECFEHQNQLTLKPLESPIVDQQIDDLSSQSASIHPTEVVEENYGDAEQIKLTSENVDVKQHDIEMSNPTVNSDSKMLLARYKKLKSKFKEVRTRTVELESKIVSLTKDLEYANSKYTKLNLQYADSNEIHEADMANCQSEIENLMEEKLEAFRKLSVLTVKHDVLQNDYDQLKSNLDDKITSNDSTNTSESSTLLKGQLNDTKHIVDSACSNVQGERSPSDSKTNLDSGIQSLKLNDIVNAKCISSNIEGDDFDFGDSVPKRLNSCYNIICEFVTSILLKQYDVELSSTNELVDLMSKIKMFAETFLKYVSEKNGDLNFVNEHHIELPLCVEDSDKNTFAFEQHVHANNSPIIEHSLPLVEDTLETSVAENEGNEHFQQAIAERDRLIAFLSEKISKLDNLSRNVDNIILIRHKLDKALTAVHERDVRCDELTLELTRLLEERDMLQLKLSNAIRQIQFMSDHKPQRDTSNLSEETYGSKNIDEKLEELHSLEYRRDADLFTDQEQRHKSQMLLHQGHQSSSSTEESMPSNTNEEMSTSQWFKDLLSW